MKQYYFRISSKNEKSLRNFLFFFLNYLKAEFNIIYGSTYSNNKRKVITLLKSPHVNKTAQEHFELHTFSRQVIVKTFLPNKNFIFVKKVINQFFQDLSFKLEFINKSDLGHKNLLFILNPNNYKLHLEKLTHKNVRRDKQKSISKSNFLAKNNLTKLSKFLNKASVFGEIITLSR